MKHLKTLMRSLVLTLLIGLALTVRMQPASAQNTQNFSITSFTADYYLDRNAKQTSTMKVIEIIAAQFPDYDQNHGILRAIPETYQDHTVSFDVQTVTNGSSAWPYTTSHQNGNTVLKIGNANSYVRGKQTYVITYTMRNVAALYDDHDELYWNANGTQWDQSFGDVTARIHIPPSFQASLNNKLRCFSGYSGSADSGNCVISQASEGQGTVITAVTKNLAPMQNLTFVIGFNKGTFVLGPEIAQAKRMMLIRHILIAAGIAILPIIAFVIMYRRWRKFGRDPQGRGVIIPEYVPPKDLSVLASDFILHETLNGKSVTAQIIALAISGYIVIYETTKKKILKDTKDYELELVKPPDGLSSEEQAIITALFGAPALVGARVALGSLKNKLYTTVTSLNKEIGDGLTNEGYFAANPKKASSRYIGTGIALIFVGFALLSLLIGIGLLLAGIIVLIFGWLMPARTESGVATRDYLRGLKEYISVAEQDRIRFLQSPEGAEKIKATGIDPMNPSQKVKLFESLLPYAMLFGQEKEWAKQFQDLYTTPPHWYQGDWATFNAVYLVSSLGNFSTVSNASFSAPSSSSSSGFGGGGFSGGGGGGGGGGGW